MKRYETARLFGVLIALAGFPTTLLADDVHCPPHLGSVTIDGNGLVAAACRLDATNVKGNVLLYSGGSVIAREETHVEGNIQAEDADFIDDAGTQINGKLQLDNMVGGRSTVDCSSVRLTSNRSGLEVLGNLQCKSNNPPPAGGNNRVGHPELRLDHPELR